MSSTNKNFAGDKKFGASILTLIERPFQRWLAARVPLWLETYHLTLLTIPWCIFILLFSYWAKGNVQWLWGVSLMIVFQYLSDLVDGEVGRQRNTGLIKWGYFMDHFLDFMFLCSLLTGYFFVLPTEFDYLHFFILSVFGAFMVHSFLSFSALDRFQIAYLGVGPTEIRIGFIVTNTLLITLGTTHMAGAMPWVLGISFVGLCITVYRTQKLIWAVDMQKKAEADTK